MSLVEEVEVNLPHPALPGADWGDCYKIEVSTKFDSAHQAAESIIAAFPNWTYPALVFRQLLVSPFGLKGAHDVSSKVKKVGIFPIVSEEPERLVAGFDDKHLDFRIVIDLKNETDSQIVSLATLIKRHNMLGRAYLQAVLPFHRAIIRSTLRRIR